MPCGGCTIKPPNQHHIGLGLPSFWGTLFHPECCIFLNFLKLSFRQQIQTTCSRNCLLTKTGRQRFLIYEGHFTQSGWPYVSTFMTSGAWMRQVPIENLPFQESKVYKQLSPSMNGYCFHYLDCKVSWTDASSMLHGPRLGLQMEVRWCCTARKMLREISFRLRRG